MNTGIPKGVDRGTEVFKRGTPRGTRVEDACRESQTTFSISQRNINVKSCLIDRSGFGATRGTEGPSMKWFGAKEVGQGTCSKLKGSRGKMVGEASGSMKSRELVLEEGHVGSWPRKLLEVELSRGKPRKLWGPTMPRKWVFWGPKTTLINCGTRNFRTPGADNGIPGYPAQ